MNVKVNIWYNNQIHSLTHLWMIIAMIVANLTSL